MKDPTQAAVTRLPLDEGENPNRKEIRMYVLQCPITGHRAAPIDDDGTDVFMCWPTLEEAVKGKKYQEKNYDMHGYEIVDLMTGGAVSVARVLGGA